MAIRMKILKASGEWQAKRRKRRGKGERGEGRGGHRAARGQQPAGGRDEAVVLVEPHVRLDQNRATMESQPSPSPRTPGSLERPPSESSPWRRRRRRPKGEHRAPRGDRGRSPRRWRRRAIPLAEEAAVLREHALLSARTVAASVVHARAPSGLRWRWRCRRSRGRSRRDGRCDALVADHRIGHAEDEAGSGDTPDA